MKVERILRHLMKCRVFSPFREDNQANESTQNAVKDLQRLELYEKFLSLQGLQGAEVYNNRFVPAMASLVFVANGLHPVIQVPGKIARYKEIINVVNAEDIDLLEKKWERQRQLTGVLTTPRPFLSRGKKEWIINYLRNKRPLVDVYSEPNRYPRVFAQIRKNIEEGGTLIEMGCGAGDNLVSLKDHFEFKIGYDNLSLRDILEDELFNKWRWLKIGGKNLQEEKDKHLSLLLQSQIVVEKGDIFDKQLYLGMKSHKRPLVIFYANSIFPHFHSEKIKEVLRMALLTNLDFLIIGGGVPANEIFDPFKKNWVTPNLFWGFKCKPKSNSFDLIFAEIGK